MSDCAASSHIALFLPSFRGGGAERVMVILANALAARGHRVDLVVANAVGPYLELVDGSVNLVDLHTPRVALSTGKLIAYFRRERPSAVLATMIHANAICAFALRLSGHKARLILREATVPTPGGSWHNKLIYRLATYLYRWSDGVVAVSEGTRDGIIPVLKIPDTLPVVVINNPFAPEMLAMAAEPLPDAVPGNPNAALILAAGRLSKTKDFATLINAVAQLRKTHDVKLVILGDGEEQKNLLALVDELDLKAHVFLPGFVRNPFSWMACCDVFALSSRLEGSPNIVIQAIACGAEVVATRLEGCTDVLLEPEGIGRLVDCGDVGQFVQALALALDEPLKPDVQAWRKRFDSARVVDEYEHVLLSKIAAQAAATLI